MEEKEIVDKVEKRLRELMLVVRHTAASDAADEAVAAIPSSPGDIAEGGVFEDGPDLEASEEIEAEN